MPNKYQSEKGEISPVQTAEHKFPIYFCEGCGAPNAGFGRAKLDGRLSYCGWEDGHAVCVGKGKGKGKDKGRAEGGGKVPVAAPPW